MRLNNESQRERERAVTEAQTQIDRDEETERQNERESEIETEIKTDIDAETEIELENTRNRFHQRSLLTNSLFLFLLFLLFASSSTRVLVDGKRQGEQEQQEQTLAEQSDVQNKVGTNVLSITGTNITCKWTKREEQAEVFWVNLDRSTARRKNMEMVLNAMGLPHHRVRGYSLKEFHVPVDIENALEARSAMCIPKTAYDPSLPNSSTALPMGKLRKVFVKGACGSANNNMKELVTVASHLLAIQQAVYSPTATSKYALIMEDDVWTPFDIDFEELIETIPSSNFGIIQLFNSKALAASEMLHRYKKIKLMWYPRPVAFDMRYLPSFSTGAYIINRAVMKPIIDSLIEENNGWTSYTILAGTTIPTCQPSVCCEPGTNEFNSSIRNCIWAPVGFQADSYLYALADTYIYTLPLFWDGLGSDESTIHQTHVVHQHKQSFRRIREFIHQMLNMEMPLPHYIHRACPASVAYATGQLQLLKTI